MILKKAALPVLSSEAMTSPHIKWVPILLVTMYYIAIWNPPNIPRVFDSWYLVLGLAVFAFLVQANKIWVSSKLFLVVHGLILLGAALSILRADDFYSALYNTVGGFITYISFLIFSQILIAPKARVALIIGIFLAALVWTVYVLTTTMELGHTAYQSFVGETDKNYGSLLFMVASTIALSFAIFWRPQTKALRNLIVRIGLVAIAAFGVFTESLLYSRSGIVATIIAIATVILIAILKLKRNEILGVMAVIIVIAAAVLLFKDDYLTSFSYWTITVERITNPDLIYRYNVGRFATLEKAVAIIEENPFLGVGAGEYKNVFVETYSRHNTGTVPHNSVLALWAETGILSMVAMGIWVFTILKLLFSKFDQLSLVDKTWVIVGIPYFIHLLTIDVYTNMLFMLLIHSAIQTDLSRKKL